jgi:hypothetical protein
MTAQIDSFQRSVATFGALVFTAVIVMASFPTVPLA